MRVLFPLPISYDGTEARYLARDGARFCQHLSPLGVQAVKLLIDDGSGHSAPRSPLLAAAPWRDWCSPEFWRRQDPAFVLLYGGLNPRLDPVAAALQQAGIPTALKMDSADGVLPFPADLQRLLRFGYYRERQSHSPLRAVLTTLARQAVRATGSQNRMLRQMLSRFTWITGESPFACDNTRRWLRHCGLNDVAQRVMLLHHPVPGEFAFDGSQPKLPQLLSIALDWSNPRKRGRMLADTLCLSLPDAEGYTAIVVGDHSESVRDHVLRRTPQFETRVRALPRCSPDQTRDLYQSSRILVIPSGAEGAPNVVTEAACCGCSIVAPPELRQLRHFEDAGCGTVSRRYGADGLAAAVVEESRAWMQGLRDPTQTSRHWGSQVHVRNVTRQLFALFGQPLPPG